MLSVCWLAFLNTPSLHHNRGYKFNTRQHSRERSNNSDCDDDERVCCADALSSERFLALLICALSHRCTTHANRAVSAVVVALSACS
jgi:hypothetical protein